jgi:hypothetical protein
LSRAEKIRLATIGRIAEETGELTRNGMRVSSFGQIIYKVNKKKVKSSHCLVDIVRTYSPSLPSYKSGFCKRSSHTQARTIKQG